MIFPDFMNGLLKEYQEVDLLLLLVPFFDAKQWQGYNPRYFQRYLWPYLQKPLPLYLGVCKEGNHLKGTVTHRYLTHTQMTLDYRGIMSSF